MAADTDALSETASQLLVYLRDRLETDGDFYTKSRDIAAEIESSSKEVGAAMRELRREQLSVEIEKWGYTNGTTWRISDA